MQTFISTYPSRSPELPSNGCELSGRGPLFLVPFQESASWLSMLYAAESPVRSSELLGFAIMFQSYDYIALFVPLVDIPVGLCSLIQWITPIDERLQLSRLNKLVEEI